MKIEKTKPKKGVSEVVSFTAVALSLPAVLSGGGDIEPALILTCVY